MESNEQKHHLTRFQERPSNTERVAKSKTTRRRNKLQVRVTTKTKRDYKLLEVLKPIRVKVGGAKENFANAWNQSER